MKIKMDDLMFGPLMMDLKGPSLTQEEKELLAHPFVGGVILFSRNFECKSQVTGLTQAIKAVKPNLLIAVDQEGGRVQRLKGGGYTDLPAMRTLGERFDRSKEKALTYAKGLGYLMGFEILTSGIDFTFAPILDLDKGVSEVIGDRAFHKDPEVVVALAGALTQGMKAAGMRAVGKHFPGHGSVAPDSHKTLPIDERPLEVIINSDLIAFQKMSDHGMPAFMTAHMLFPAVDEKLPVTLSRTWLHDILRIQLGFKGAVFSDDLMMKGLLEFSDIIDRASLAIEAGCDMILVCNDRQSVEKLLSHFNEHMISETSMRRLAHMLPISMSRGSHLS